MQAVLSWKIDNSTYAYIQQIDGSYISGKLDSDSNEWISLKNEVSSMTREQYRSAFDAMSAALSGMGITVTWDESYFDDTKPDNDIILLEGPGGGTDGSVSYEVLEEELNQVKIDILNEVNGSLDVYLKNSIQNTVQEIINQSTAGIEEMLQDMQNMVNEAIGQMNNLQAEMEDSLKDAIEALEKASELFDLGDNITADDLIAAISASTYLTEIFEEFSAYTVNAITSITDEIDEVLMKAESAITAIGTVVGNVELMQQTVSTLSGICYGLSAVCASLSATVASYSTRITNMESEVSYLGGAVSALSASVISLSAATVIISGNLTTLRDEYDEWMELHDEFIVDLQSSADTIYGIISDYIAALRRMGVSADLFKAILDDLDENIDRIRNVETLIAELKAIVMTFDSRILDNTNKINELIAGGGGGGGESGDMTEIIERIESLETSASESAYTLNMKIESMTKIVITASTPSVFEDKTLYFIAP